MPDRNQIVSRTTDDPASVAGSVVQTRRFGRRPAASSTSATAAPPSGFEPSPSVNAALDNDEMWRGPDRATRLRKRLVAAVMLVGIGLVVGVVLPNSTFGLPDCDSYKTTNLLNSIARDALTKTKATYTTIRFTEMNEIDAEARGVHRCKGVLLVDGQPALRLVYEISWRVRLVVFNQYEVKVISTTR